MAHITARANFTLLHASSALHNKSGDECVCVLWGGIQENYWPITPHWWMQLSRGVSHSTATGLKAPAVLCRCSSQHKSSMLMMKNVLPLDSKVAPVSKSNCRNVFKGSLMYDVSRGVYEHLPPFPPVNGVFHCRHLFGSKDFSGENPEGWKSFSSLINS